MEHAVTALWSEEPYDATSAKSSIWLLYRLLGIIYSTITNISYQRDPYASNHLEVAPITVIGVCAYGCRATQNLQCLCRYQNCY